MEHAIHKDVSDKVMPGTGEWVFEEPAVKDWLAGTKKLVWGTGIREQITFKYSSIMLDLCQHSWSGKDLPIVSPQDLLEQIGFN